MRVTGSGRARGHLGETAAAFVDGQLSGAEEAAVRRHLEHCSACAENVRAQRSLKQRMSGLSVAPVAPPPTLVGRLSGLGERLTPPEGTPAAWRIAPLDPAESRRRRTPVAAAVVGGMTVAAALGAYAVSPGRAPAGAADPGLRTSSASTTSLPASAGSTPSAQRSPAPRTQAERPPAPSLRSAARPGRTGTSERGSNGAPRSSPVATVWGAVEALTTVAVRSPIPAAGRR